MGPWSTACAMGGGRHDLSSLKPNEKYITDFMVYAKNQSLSVR